jgi:hypothetical protein
MSEDIKKIERTEQAAELSQQDLDKIAGGDREASAPSVSEIVVTKPNTMISG